MQTIKRKIASPKTVSSGFKKVPMSEFKQSPAPTNNDLLSISFVRLCTLICVVEGLQSQRSYVLAEKLWTTNFASEYHWQAKNQTATSCH
ncbi:MAG: hypothetical protein HY253_03790 [Burkholderiales bacterium]|nr:hypothetical protein [Burkholderiales bacterium]